MADAATTANTAAVADVPQGDSRLWVIARTAFPFLVVGAMWEITAHAGVFPPRLFPTLEEIAAAFWRLTVAGILPRHVAETLLRLLAGFALAAAAGVAIGIAMGRSKRAEDYLLPLVIYRRADPRHRLCAAVHAVVRARQFLRHPARRLRLRLRDHLQHLDRREGGQGNLGPLGAGHGRRPAPAVPARDPAGRTALHLHRPAAWAGAGLAHPGRGGAARGGAMGARLAHLRRARVPQHRRDARGRRGDRHRRAGAREARVRAARATTPSCAGG